MPSVAQQTNVQSIDDRLWNDTKQALDRIAQHAEDILAQWVTVGLRLQELRKRNPGYRSATFSAACRQRGIELTPNQRSTAMWWAQLDDRQRDVLSDKYPDALTPGRLQDCCRETHPEWAKARKSHTSRSTVSKGSDARKSPMPRFQKDAQREVYREELKAQREHKAAVAVIAAANDKRPTLTPTPYPVVMYGVQLWPVTDEDRLKVGQYNYDALVFAVRQFTNWKDIAKVAEPSDLARNLKLRWRPLCQFIERRLVGDPQIEMRQFVHLMLRLADLYEANPEGECRPPTDRALFEA